VIETKSKPKTHMDEVHALMILSTIPSTTAYDRLYVHSDGVFKVDVSHRYIGHIGRSFMDTVVGGHNRGRVTRSIVDLLSALLRLAHQCVAKLQTPPVNGTLHTNDGLDTVDDVQLYIGYADQLSGNLRNVHVLIHTLQLVYLADSSVCRLLDDTLQEIETIDRVIAPILPRVGRHRAKGE
jgi:hypothetical protein